VLISHMLDWSISNY